MASKLIVAVPNIARGFCGLVPHFSKMFGGLQKSFSVSEINKRKQKT
jgi:hypothetical protein